jgi:hypothetical protein
MSVGSMPSLHRSNIGNVRDGLRMLAEVIRGKCERARCKHEHVMVLIDDLGEVYASFATSGTTMLASLRNPSWLVGVYSCAFEKHRAGALTKDIPDRAPLPTVPEIVQDMQLRANEVRIGKAA